MSFLIPDVAIAFMLTFARVGTMVMLMPGIEQLITTRARLSFAFLLTLVLFPPTRTILPAVGQPTAAIGLLIGEIAVGLLIGLAIRMVVGALQTAGTGGAAARALLRHDGRPGDGRPAGLARQPAHAPRSR